MNPRSSLTWFGFGWSALLLCVVFGCGEKQPTGPQMTTDTKSSALASKQERIQFVFRYLGEMLRADVNDAEFHIQYQDPPPGTEPPIGTWDYKIVLKIPPEESYAWHGGFKECGDEQPDLSWVEEIVGGKPGWERRSKPDCYCLSDQFVCIYKPEGIVVYRHVREK